MASKDNQSIQLYISHPHACSYIDKQKASSLFVDPKLPIDAQTYSYLTELGFRRSGPHVYRPQCKQCQACIPIRVLAKQYEPNRNQRRCKKNNRDLTATISRNIDTEEHYELYERYIAQRHSDGDMYPATQEQFRDFLSPQWGITRYVEYRDKRCRLIGVATVDVLVNGLSAVYTYFDPEESKRSLGVFSVIYQIHLAQQLNLPYVYLGYWIKDCRKMNYKTGYHPYEVLIDQVWQPEPEAKLEILEK